MYRARQFTRAMAAMAVPYNDRLDPARSRAYVTAMNAILTGSDPDVVLARLEARINPATN